MLASYLIGIREGLEAALIIGLALGALTKLNQDQYKRSIWTGVAAAVVLSIATAAVLGYIGLSLEGAAEEIFEGITMLLAAGVLSWMIFWMRRNSRQFRDGFEQDVKQAALGGGAWPLFSIAFFAVLREGVETALFLSAAALTSGSGQALAGGLLGIASAILLGWALAASTIRLNLQNFFTVTSLLLILFAAGLFAHGIHEFVEVGWLPAILDPVYDLNPILSEESLLGTTLKTVFGYNGNPSLTEAIAYVAYYVLIWIGIRRDLRSAPQRVVSTP
jgi:high-affinity iron transporter